MSKTKKTTAKPKQKIIKNSKETLPSSQGVVFKLSLPKKIQKRDGRVADFDWRRITDAVFKAFEASGQPDRNLAESVTRSVLDKIGKKHKSDASKFVPTIEQVQDFVEESLMELGFAKVAKSYILYRQKRAVLRKEKQEILNKTEIDEVDKKFDPNALRVLRSRYLRKDDNGGVAESPKMLFTRVAVHTALPDILYDPRVSKNNKAPVAHEEGCPCCAEGADEAKISDEEAGKLEGSLKIGNYRLNIFNIKALYRVFKRFEKRGCAQITWDKLVSMLKADEFKEYEKTVDDFYNLMVNRKFMPNTPTLANFGSYLGMGSACFALDIEDSINSIMETLKQASVIFKAGGGLGYNFSKLRPEGDFIKTTGGASSGPISFMRLFDTMTEVVKQGGIRRGANMGIMNSNHPDIEKFITAKKGNQFLKNFNISVLVMPEFWDCYKKNKPYQLINPRTKKTEKYVSPKDFLEKISYQAWESAEPGVIFFDRINEYNPFFKSLGPIVTTNPCGELLLYPNESCNLGSLNLWQFVKNGSAKKWIDWDSLAKATRVGVHFLDNVIDINKFPLKQIEDMTMKTRKIGLGVMGVADLLFEMEMPFNSEKGRMMMEKIAEFVNYHSKAESVDMAKRRGSFSLFKESFYEEGKLPFKGFAEKKSWSFDWKDMARQIKKHGLRNSYTTVIAPTGSVSMISGCSSGIEPAFSLVYQKNVAVGTFYYINPVFEKAMLREGLFDEDLVTGVVSNRGSVQKINYIPPKMKKIFVTSHDVSAEDHIRSMASFQKWVDSSISKTINFPREATVKDMEKAYSLAYDLGCKDVAVFRDTSIKDQVFSVAIDGKKNKVDGLTSLKDDKAKGVAVYHDPGVTVINADNGVKGVSGGGKPTHCPSCKVELTYQEGCVFCSVCGWGMCV
jgi:ribonucleoside-diphosphate reductase alpha chain